MQTPEAFGRYIIRQTIGRGGMAHVYLAHDPRFGRDVALKVISAAFMAEPTFRGRFEREARTIATLEHPAIVPVYDFGEDHGQLYLVMRYMPGGSLNEQIYQRPFPLDTAVSLVQRIGAALDHAHQQGVIHRDLKPANILFDRYGHPFLSDFGIVKLAEATGGFTGSGVIGTPAYMSPEQIHSEEEIDGRSDIYTLGILFFEMLTGLKPYRADTPVKQMMAHVLNPIPHICEYRADLPATLEPVVAKVLAKKREERYATAHDFAQALLAALPDLSLGALTPFPRDGKETSSPPAPVNSGENTDEPTATIAPDALPPPTETVMPAIAAPTNEIDPPTIVAQPLQSSTDHPPLITPKQQAAAVRARPWRRWLLWAATAVAAVLVVSLSYVFILPIFQESQPWGNNEPFITGPPPATYTPTSPAPTATVVQESVVTTAVTPTPTDSGIPQQIEIGKSVSGISIVAYRFGLGEQRLVLVGGIHAGFAPGSVDVALEAITHFSENESDIPANVSLWIVPALNPDSTEMAGELAGRLNANNVDLNRNWGCLWQPSPTWRGTPVPGMGGTAPFSEPEVSALATFLQNNPPAAVLFWGAQAQNGLVSAGSCGDRPVVSSDLARTFASGADYQYVDFEGLTQQKIPGDGTNWLDQQGIPAMTVLLPAYEAIDWESNLNGIRALITAVATANADAPIE